VTDPRFGELVCDIARVVIGEFSSSEVVWSCLDKRADMYQSVIGQAPLIDSLFVRLHKKVLTELKFQAELQRMKGALNMLTLSSQISSLV
jgi:U3 small nucleolar RNA-associated protein 15